MSTVFYSCNPSISSAVQATLDTFSAQGYFPTASVAVFTATETLCQVAIGDATPDTVFDVASLTKIATATQALLAIDQGKIALSDGILAHLPELANNPLIRDRLNSVTIESLLTHTSGIDDWYPFYAAGGDFPHALRAAFEFYPPVSGVVYSDLNFMLLGEILSALYIKPLEACLQQNLVLPLSLGRMTYHPDLAWDIAPSCYGNPIEEEMCRERGITFSGWRPHTATRGETNDGNAFYFFGGEAGSAGIFADVHAYQRLGQYHLNEKSPLFLKAQTECAPGRGLGWQVSDMYPDGFGHTGFTGTSIYLSPKRNIGVVAFTNRLFYPEHNPRMTNDFRRALHKAVVEAL